MGLCADDARKALAPALNEHLAKARYTLLGLVGLTPKASASDQAIPTSCEKTKAPPQVLLLEGGVEAERQAMALWWATVQHCQEPRPSAQHSAFEPCGQCPACLHIGMGIHADVLAYDGRISNTADLENPGPVRALNKENAQALKGKMGDTTRSGHKRVVIISGIDTSRSAAANALLKVLEEPSPTTIFVLLTPQREQILPTLVSRSWVYTLPWPPAHHVSAELAPWEQALATFLQRGVGWWPMTSGKGAVTPEMATQVLLLCQKRLLTSLMNTARAAEQGPLTTCFAPLDAQKRLCITQYIDAAQEALHYNVNPSRVLDALAVQLSTLYQQR